MRLDWKVLGSAMGCFLAISYVLCVTYDLLFGAQMYRAWVDLLPGSHWLSWLGLVETIAYVVFFGLVLAPLCVEARVMTSYVAAAAQTAQAVAKKLEIDEVIAGVPPDQKVEGIKRPRKEGTSWRWRETR